MNKAEKLNLLMSKVYSLLNNYHILLHIINLILNSLNKVQFLVM